MIYHLSMVSMFIVDIYLRLGLSETKRFLMMSFRGLNHGSGRNQVCQNRRTNLQETEFDANLMIESRFSGLSFSLKARELLDGFRC